jgi:hypothetical protein
MMSETTDNPFTSTTESFVVNDWHKTEPMPEAIARAICQVMSQVDYVEKKGENTFHNYKFAAVGDLLEKIQPAMAAAGLSVVQTEVEHCFKGNGAVMLATYEFLLSHVSGVTWGERPRHTGMATAMNTKGGFDDKALNKCHTAARKYFLLSLFQIPTGTEPDPDEQEDAPPPPQQTRGRPPQGRPQTDPRGQRMPQQGQAPQTQNQAPAEIPLFVPTGETIHFRRGSEWLNAWVREFDACELMEDKAAFFDANIGTFQQLQSRAPADVRDTFADQAERAFNILNG